MSRFQKMSLKGFWNVEVEFHNRFFIIMHMSLMDDDKVFSKSNEFLMGFFWKLGGGSDKLVIFSKNSNCKIFSTVRRFQDSFEEYETMKFQWYFP